MRTLLKVTLDVAAANKALMEGSLPKIMQSTIENLSLKRVIFTLLTVVDLVFVLI